MLNERDFVSLVAIAGDKYVSHYSSSAEPYTDQQQVQEGTANTTSTHHRKHQQHPTRMHAATLDNKLNFIRFINQLNGTKEITNHSMAFQNAFGLLHGITSNRKQPAIHMLYISRGLVSPLTEAKYVLQAVADGQRALNVPPITISTCAVILGINIYI